jgi:O-antigen/teichoic acid export membrane protein
MNDKPSIRRNVISLFLLQGANYIFPLLTLPWLTRTLGPDGFGRIGFATAFCMYFSLFSDYGFNLSATRRIAIHRDDRIECSRIFWATFTTKVILAVAGFLFLLVVTSVVSRLTQERPLLIIGYLAVVGTVLTPIWYFQGIEQMTALTIVNLIARGATLPLIFILVHGKDDVWLAMLITSATGLLAGCFSIVALVRLRHVHWIAPSIADIRQSIQDGWHLFVSSVGISFYTTSTTIILGFVAGNVEVGYFTAAQRLIRASQAMITPLSQAVYPRISHLMHNSRDEAFALINKVFKLQSGLTFLVSLTLFLGAPFVIKVVFGPTYINAITTLRWLAPLPFVIGLSNIFAMQILLPLGFDRMVTNIVIFVGIVNIFAVFLLSKLYGSSGASVAVLFAEILVTSFSFMIVTKYKLWRNI